MLKKGVVVFDVDGVLLSSGCSEFDIEYSKNQIRQVVGLAFRNDYGLAINTARLGIGSPLANYLYSVGVDITLIPSGAVQTGNINPKLKAKGMKKIQKAYGIDNKDRILFFDDKPENVAAVKKAGYDAALVKKTSGRGCLMISDTDRIYADKHFKVK